MKKVIHFVSAMGNQHDSVGLGTIISEKSNSCHFVHAGLYCYYFYFKAGCML